MIKRCIFAVILAFSTFSEVYGSPVAVDVLKALSDDEMQGRRSGTEGGRKAADYIINKVSSFGLATQTHEFFLSNGGEGRNLIVKVAGTVVADGPVLVLSAHYDHTGVRNGAVNNGADDNASGVGGLFAIIQHFKKKPPKHDIWFVFFDEEEGGINGSNWFVQQHPHLMVRPILNVNLDMIGRPQDGVVFVTGGLLDPALGKVVESIPESDRIRIKFEGDGPEFDGRKNWRTSSDHRHLYERDVPFLFIHTGVHEDYHRPSDDVKKINLEDYIAVVNWTIKLVEKLNNDLGTLAKIPSEPSL